MKLTMHITEVKNLVARRWGSITAGTAIRGFVVGVLIMAGTGMYFGIIPGNQEGNPASNVGTIAFSSQDWHELMAAGLEADLESYRSFLPGYVDEEGNSASGEATTALPSQDWHEQMAAGLEADLESYRSFRPGYVDEEGNPASSS